MRHARLLGLATVVMLAACEVTPNHVLAPEAPPVTAAETAAGPVEPGTVASAEGLFELGTDAAMSSLSSESVSTTMSSNHAPTGGINPVVTESGLISLSVDGLGILGSSGTIQVDKPAGATVRGAYMAAAGTWARGAIPNGAITLNGSGVFWSQQVSINPAISHFADVTSQVKGTLDAAPPGMVNLTITESNSGAIDGSILAVIFDDPNQTTENTVSLLFGGQRITGDDFFLGLNEPLDKSNPDLVMDLSLGISFGFQPSAQVSLVDVNGTRMTSSAGGQDDGQDGDGALLTVGGIGDTNGNPPPLTGASSPRTDDELYSLIPFVDDGDQLVTIHTVNPSRDDNIFFAALFLSVEAAVVTVEPAAQAGPDQTVEQPNLVDLDGSASFDPDGTLVSYQWFLGGTLIASGPTPTGLTLPLGANEVRLVVTDDDGLTDEDFVVITVVPPADVTPPAISWELDGPLGDNGWYVGPVTITWTVVDPDSEVTSTTGCETVTVSADGTGYSFTCSATSAGGSASVTSDPFMIDATPPSVSGALSGPLGDNGWYVGPVTVAWTVTDGGSGVATACVDETESADGTGFGFSCTATDVAGNSASADSDVFMIDATDPTVSYSGNLGTYDAADDISITCSASDATSGIAGDTCADVNAPAWTFGVGTHTVTAAATDNAGNGSSASTSFNVEVSYDGLCTLVRAFVSQAGVANSLCVKLEAAARAEDRGRLNARDGSLGSFINEVDAQAGKWVPEDKAPVLVALAEALMS